MREGGSERRCGRGPLGYDMVQLPVVHHVSVGGDGGLVDDGGPARHGLLAHEGLESRDGVEANFFHVTQPACTPSDFARGIHCLRSASMKRANSCCEPGMGWAPMRCSFSISSGFRNAWLMALLMASIAGCGVPVRAITPTHAAASRPGKPGSCH